MQNNCIKRLGIWKAEVKLTIMFGLLLRFVSRPLVNLFEGSAYEVQLQLWSQSVLSLSLQSRLVENFVNRRI